MQFTEQTSKNIDVGDVTKRIKARMETSEQPIKVREPNFETMLLADRIDSFVKAIENSPDFNASFEVEVNLKGEPRIRFDQAGSAIRLLLRAGAASLPIRYPGELFGPRVLLFAKMAVKQGLETLQDADLVGSIVVVKGIAARLKAFSRMLCERAHSIRHQKRVRHHTKASRKNFRGACNLVDHLVMKYKRGLRVIRLDLGYKRNTKLCVFDRPLTAEEVFAHRAAFIAELPNLVHDQALVAYIWRTEFKPAKGYHHHFLIFLDAGKARQDITIARMLGEYFVSAITDHRGSYQNVNAEYLARQDEPTTYVGLIRPGDVQRIESLKQIGVDYVCKPDYLIGWIMPAGHRAFGRSELKEEWTSSISNSQRLAHSVSQRPSKMEATKQRRIHAGIAT